MFDRVSILQIIRKTYPFVILRFLVIVLTLAPIAWVTIYFAGFFFRFFKLDVEGPVYVVFWLNFAMIGCMVGVGAFGFVRKTVLFYIKAAHVIAITKLCTDDAGSLLTLTSLNEVRKRFISVNIFYIADGLLMAGIRDIGNALLRQDILPALNPSNKSDSVLGKLKNLGLKFLGQTIKTALSYCDEIVLSYVYVRTRFEELYNIAKNENKRPGRKLTREGKKKSSIKILFGYAVDGICLYVKNCPSLLKSAFMVVLQVNIFGWLVSIVSCVIIFTLLGSGIIKTLTVFILIRIIFSLLSYTFIEPYETAALVSEFYAVMYEDEEDLQLDKIKDKLVGFSAPFKKMVAKAQGREEASPDEQMSKNTTGNILEEDIVGAVGAAFSNAFKEENVKQSQTKEDETFNKNIESLKDEKTL